MKISFGMIFTIILIIFFMAFAFFTIKKFIDIQKQAQIGSFLEDLKKDVDEKWNSMKSDKEYTYVLPTKIKKVCFVNLKNPSGSGVDKSYMEEFDLNSIGHENLFFYPMDAAEGMPSKEIKHINITKITDPRNPYCILNQKGKVKITIKKDYGDNFVILK